MSNDGSLPNRIASAKGKLGECIKMVADFRRTQIDSWRQLVGPLVDKILESRQDTLGHLEHSDSKVRFVALSAMVDYWKVRFPDPFVQVCETMALNDPDLQIRSVALSSLGMCYADTNHANVGRLLATIVYSESEPTHARGAAYFSLFALRGSRLLRPRDYPNLLAGNVRIPEDIDWAFVDSFLT